VIFQRLQSPSVVVLWMREAFLEAAGPNQIGAASVKTCVPPGASARRFLVTGGKREANHEAF
jgi:hypothetical protein